MLLLTMAMSMVFTSMAQAAPPPGRVSGLDCLREWDLNDDYVGEGWVQARVAEVDGVVLGCGDERSGMIHIAHEQSGGSTHPVDASNYGAFLECFGLLVRSGRQSPDVDHPQTRTRYDLVYKYSSAGGYPIPLHAVVIKDNAGGFVYTMFTSTVEVARGNDWTGCTRRGLV